MSRKYFEEEVIQQTLDYNYAQHSDAAKFNIAYGIDKTFFWLWCLYCIGSPR